MNRNERRNIRVLLVDYDAEFLEVSKRCLALQGDFEIETAASSEQAMKKIEKTKPDVIVCDLLKSITDDFQFLKILRSKGNITPFIIFTFADDKEFEDKAHQMGANGFVRKFGDPSVVYSALKHCIFTVARTK